MYKAVIPFASGGVVFKAGDDVPEMINNDKRLEKGLIKEVKIVKTEETKNDKSRVSNDVNKRKPKNKTKQVK